MALPADIRIDALGDSALVLRLQAAIDEATDERVHALAAWIAADFPIDMTRLAAIADEVAAVNQGP